MFPPPFFFWIHFMSIFSKLSDKSLTYLVKAEICLEHYRASMSAQFEPEWMHPAYEILQKFIQGSLPVEKMNLVKEIIASHECEDGRTVTVQPGVPASGKRVMHDGWKIGSSTWVFMGRKDYAKRLNDDWILVSRKIPDKIFSLNFESDLPNEVWIAYHRRRQMGFSPMDNFIGPTPYLDDLYSEFDKMGLVIEKD